MAAILRTVARNGGTLPALRRFRPVCGIFLFEHGTDTALSSPGITDEGVPDVQDRSSRRLRARGRPCCVRRGCPQPSGAGERPLQAAASSRSVAPRSPNSTAAAKNAYGRCVSKLYERSRRDTTNASKQCAAERADASFADRPWRQDVRAVLRQRQERTQRVRQVRLPEVRSATQERQEKTIAGREDVQGTSAPRWEQRPSRRNTATGRTRSASASRRSRTPEP